MATADFYFPASLGVLSLCRARLINHRTVFGGGNGLAGCSRGFQPCLLGNLHLPQGLSRGIADRRAEPQVRNVGYPASILVAIEQIDAVPISRIHFCLVGACLL